MIEILKFLFFPGLLFLGVYGLVMEYLDRHIYAKLQNRQGPPWYQPLADMLKLVGKETIIPKDADKSLFKILPAIAFAAAAVSFFYMPVWGDSALFSFEGDLVVVLYLLTIPTLAFFLAGWYSTSLYATIGATRTLTQLFSYEVPLFMALLSPAIIAETWSITGIAEFYSQHPLYLIINIPAFCVAVIACQGKLERLPFDQPEAETELAGGTFVEYSGVLLAFFRSTIDVELVVVSSLIAAIFLPFFTGIAWLDFVLYIVKTLVILFILCVIKSAVARLRIEQMVKFCWRVLTPVALAQILINIILKGVLPL